MLVLGISAVGRGVFGGGLCVGWRIAGRGGVGLFVCCFSKLFCWCWRGIGEGGQWALGYHSMEFGSLDTFLIFPNFLSLKSSDN